MTGTMRHNQSVAMMSPPTTHQLPEITECIMVQKLTGETLHHQRKRLLFLQTPWCDKPLR